MALSNEFDPILWVNPTDEISVPLSEMKIEIILNNFNQHVMDHSSCIFIPAEEEIIPPSIPSESEYTYRNGFKTALWEKIHVEIFSHVHFFFRIPSAFCTTYLPPGIM